jgi:type II secretory pathway pseudopilin PulG
MVMESGRVSSVRERKVSRGNGFTVVEILVAILILSFGILAFMSAAFSIPRLTAESREDGRVSTLAVKELENLRVRVCAGAGSGRRTAGSRTISWSAVPLDRDVHRTWVIIETETRSGSRVDSLAGSVAC